MSKRARRKLEKEDPWHCPPDDLLHIPRALDRSKWTDAEWEASREAWERLHARTRQRIQDINKNRAFEKTRQIRAEREEKKARRLARQEVKQARREKRMEKSITDERVFTQLERGRETARSISKVLSVETRVVRQSLRRLIKKGKVEKKSERRYCLVVKKKRRRGVPDEWPD